MGRLIDADELIKCLEGAVWNDAVEVVNEQPTAYDVDKVVEEVQSVKLPLASQTSRIVGYIRKSGVNE